MDACTDHRQCCSGICHFEYSGGAHARCLGYRPPEPPGGWGKSLEIFPPRGLTVAALEGTVPTPKITAASVPAFTVVSILEQKTQVKETPAVASIEAESHDEAAVTALPSGSLIEERSRPLKCKAWNHVCKKHSQCCSGECEFHTYGVWDEGLCKGDKHHMARAVPEVEASEHAAMIPASDAAAATPSLDAVLAPSSFLTVVTKDAAKPSSSSIPLEADKKPKRPKCLNWNSKCLDSSQCCSGACVFHHLGVGRHGRCKGGKKLHEEVSPAEETLEAEAEAEVETPEDAPKTADLEAASLQGHDPNKDNERAPPAAGLEDYIPECAQWSEKCLLTVDCCEGMKCFYHSHYRLHGHCMRAWNDTRDAPTTTTAMTTTTPVATGTSAPSTITLHGPPSGPTEEAAANRRRASDSAPETAFPSTDEPAQAAPASTHDTAGHYTDHHRWTESGSDSESEDSDLPHDSDSDGTDSPSSRSAARAHERREAAFERYVSFLDRRQTQPGRCQARLKICFAKEDCCSTLECMRKGTDVADNGPYQCRHIEEDGFYPVGA